MYSKRERVSPKIAKNDPFLKGQDVVGALKSLQDPVRRLEQLFSGTRARFTQHQLDVTHGSMSSRTAEAFCYTFTDGLQFLTDYITPYPSSRYPEEHSLEMPHNKTH